MRFDKADLTFKALLVVQEAVCGASKGPTKISIGLRFALAYLYASAEKPDIDQFRRFATCVANPMTFETEYMGNYMRSTEARGHLTAFVAMAGIEANMDNLSKLRVAFEALAETPPPNAPDGKTHKN